jgi:hypothetical protein
MRKIFFVLLIILVLINFSGCFIDLEEPQEPQEPQKIIYYISTAEELYNLRYINNRHYKQIADIDLSEYENWIPIGDKKPFSGSYDGNGFKITNLKINTKELDNVGLFSEVTRFSKISNVTLENVDIKGNNYVGGIVGRNLGEISNSKVSGIISGKNFVGGITGYNYRIITECYAEILIEAYNYIGGLTGENRGIVENNNSNGKIRGNDYVGGLIGLNTGTVENSISNGEVHGNIYVGGLIGNTRKNILKNNFSDVKVIGRDNIGGLIGYSSSRIENSYALGNVIGRNYIGGLIGYIEKNSVVNSYSENNVTGTSNLGGFVGYNNYGIIKNCYSVGEVKSNFVTSSKGGFLGINLEEIGIIEKSYYNLEKSEISDKYAEGKSTIEMKKKETFIGWDFENIWDIDEGKSYPFLRSEN